MANSKSLQIIFQHTNTLIILLCLFFLVLSGCATDKISDKISGEIDKISGKFHKISGKLYKKRSSKVHKSRKTSPKKIKKSRKVQKTSNKSHKTSRKKHKTYKGVENKIRKIYSHWKGTRYKMGGTTRKGVDCSGFVGVIYKKVYSITLPHSTKLIAKMGKSVRKKNLRTGDLVLFKTGLTRRHVGVYLSKNEFVHASTSKGVTISKLDNPYYWKKKYWKAKHITK